MEDELDELYGDIKKVEAVRDLLKAAMKDIGADWEDHDDECLDESVSEALHGKYARIERLQAKIAIAEENEMIRDAHYDCR